MPFQINKNSEEHTQSPKPNTVQTKAQSGVISRQTGTSKQTKQSNLTPYASKEGQKSTIQAKQRPVQRNGKQGQSGGMQSQGDDLKSVMGNQYGVDLSGHKEYKDSAFPGSVGALATIQGKDIHYAPGQFTEKNRKHELGHAIDNSINGTPKGDTMVQGQNIDTTREAAADKIMNAPLQRKATDNKSETGIASQEAPLQRKTETNNGVVQRVIKTKDGEKYDGEYAKEGGYTFGKTTLALMNSKETFLMKGFNEINVMDAAPHHPKKPNYRGVEILTPERHLIGEVHSDSSFAKAKQKWSSGWAGGGAFEGQEHFETHDNKALQNHPSKEKDPNLFPLENVIAKSFASLYIGLQMVDKFSKTKKNILSTYDEKAEQTAKTDEAWMKEKDEFIGHINAFDVLTLKTMKAYYKQKDQNEEVKKRLELVETIRKRLQMAKKQMTSQGAKGKFSGIGFRHFEISINKLIPGMTDILKEDQLENWKGIQGKGGFDKMGIQEQNDATDRLREFNMIDNIQKMKTPAIVLLGNMHVFNLKKMDQRTNFFAQEKTVPYMNYKEFEEATKAENVIKRLGL